MDSAANTEVALRLYDAGYDLVPILPVGAEIDPISNLPASAGGKIPARRLDTGRWVGLTNWADREITRDDIECAARAGAGLGLRTRRYPCLDSDVSDSTLAPIVREALTRLFSTAPLREGNSPKFALACRAESPFSKQVIVLRDAEGSERGRIEVLGSGNQVVLAGTHPKTKRRYRWFDRGQEGDVEVLAARSPESLPILTLSALSDTVIPALNDALRGHGISVDLLGGVRGESAHDVDQASLRAPSIDALRVAVSLIPNEGQFDDRTKWIALGHAIKAAADDDSEGLRIFTEFSGRWNGPSSGPEYVQNIWDGLRAPHKTGWPWIAALARPHGFHDAGFDFDAVEADGVPDAPPVLQTIGQRLAALTGVPERVLLLESAKLQGAALFERMRTLQEAVTTGDRLTSFFRGTVIERADAARRYAAQLDHFVVMLGAKLANNARWRALLPSDRSLLERAAFVFVAEFSALQNLRDEDSLVPVGPQEEAARVDSLDIPCGSLVMFSAAPGVGKTTLALELAASTATPPNITEDELTAQPREESRRFAGRSVAHGRVIYFASEDSKGLARRRDRWARANSASPDYLTIFSAVPLLTDAGRAFNTVVRAVEATETIGAPPARLIVIDVARSAIAGDENSSEVISRAMVTADLLRRATGATILLVHHESRAGAGPRGSSAFDAAMDVMASISNDSGTITMKITKHRAAPGGATYCWHINADGVLRDGRGGRAVMDAGGVEEDAQTIARLVGELATPDEGITGAKLRNALREDHAHRFGKDVTGKTTTGQRRITRGIERAEERGWLSFDVKRKRYIAGTPPPPANLDDAVASVDAILS